MTDIPNQRPLPADFGFTFSPSLSSWNHPAPTWQALNSKHYDGIMTSAAVFHPIKNSHILLIQRALHDSRPGLWEMPGGGVDDEDPSILHGCARELWEEAGLKARFIKRHVSDGQRDLTGGLGGSVFTSSRGKLICGFVFEVEVEMGDEGVNLDENEHIGFIWATEEEVRGGKMDDGREIPLTGPVATKTVMEAFRLKKEAEGS